MPNFKQMSIDELEAYREGLAKKMGESRKSFRAAGAALEEKRAKEPAAIALAKLQEAQAELDALSKEETDA